MALAAWRRAALLTLAVAACAGPSPAVAADATLRLDLRPGGRAVPEHFAGLSIEWSLIERYMGPRARPAFAQMLRNLGTGELRIGGSSQDLMPFDAVAPDTNRVITPEDLRAIASTLDIANGGVARTVPRWGAILGTALAPPDEERPWAGPEHARAFATQGVAPAFAGHAQRYVAGIGLGNEPDISYRYDLARYLTDLTAYRDAAVTRPFAIAAPSTSETIAPWQQIERRAVQTRFFLDWPVILDTIAPALKAVRGAFGTLATDHFYPLARGCATDEYRCASIERLLSDERLDNLAYEIYTHAGEAAARGVEYRLQETGTAAGRGVAGVSNVAASATWALAAMFETACPQPPNAPGANALCTRGGVGMNLHNAEVNDFFAPEEGNAFYNAVAYDPTPAAGAPSATPGYYALLFFGQFVQGTRGLRPLTVAGGAQLDAWQVDAVPLQRRIFLVNRSSVAQTAAIAALDRSAYKVDRMTPFDPTGAGRTLDATQVRIDGRSVSASGRWPGFAPANGRVAGGVARVALAPGEAAAVTLRIR